MSHNARKLVFGVSKFNRRNTNQPVQSQKKARGMNFLLYVEEEFYYQSSENKCADQLRSNCEADLRLCFCTGRNLVLS